MAELDVLDRDIKGLKRLLRVAWEELANRSFTPFGYLFSVSGRPFR